METIDMCMLRDRPMRPRRICPRAPGSKRRAAAVICLVAVAIVASSSVALAEPLEYVPFASFWVKGVCSRIEGRFGFAQENGGIGTLNDLVHDLGLPVSNVTFDLGARVRPLEHHILRVYGRIPEVYKGGRTISRALQTRNVTYAAGTAIISELKTGMFGLGYDLDFLAGPRWFGGLNGDLRHVGVRLRMGSAASVFEDTMAINEMIPCLGGHLLFRSPARVGPGPGLLSVGGFSRITFSMTPNWFNYLEVSAGVSLGIVRSGSLSIESRLGYNYEVFFHNQESLAGRALELQRDGVLLSLEGLF